VRRLLDGVSCSIGMHAWQLERCWTRMGDLLHSIPCKTRHACIMRCWTLLRDLVRSIAYKTRHACIMRSRMAAVRQDGSTATLAVAVSNASAWAAC
jgi:hypothetical protein